MKKLLLVVMASLMALSLFAGCSASMAPQENGNDGDYDSKGEAYEEPQASSALDYGSVSDAEAPVAEESAAPAEGTGSGLNYDNSILQPGVNRKIIYEGEIRARTKHYDDDLKTILGKLKEYGGYQQEASTEGTAPENWQDQGRNATLTLRVPSEHFDDFMNVLKGLGKTVSTSVKGRDISETYFDTETRLSSLRIQESRLQDLLKKAATLEDIIEIEKQLEDTTYQIESLQSQLRDYDSLIDYSTVTVYLTEVNEIQSVNPTDEPLGGRISSAFYGVMNVLAKIGEGLVIFFVGGSPILVPLIIVGVILIIIFARKKKKKAAMKNNNTPIV